MYPSIWKNGPSWLSQNENLWPYKNVIVDEVPEKRNVVVSLICTKLTICKKDILEKYSTF